MKLHLEGKTEQARADLARLAIIKKQREDAAKKRDELKKGEGGGRVGASLTIICSCCGIQDTELVGLFYIHSLSV